ncbi:hypothetical protein ACIBBB_29555 [Streptomyces sp. NPDC051217]|uniref:hypothetical protein n=1 Tax=Streptomyces sp. NPDC051217 TaxID=3365644 RepID=UPI0037B7A7E1
MGVAATDHSGPWTLDDVLALPDDARNRLVQAGERTSLAEPFPFDIDPAQLVKR